MSKTKTTHGKTKKEDKNITDKTKKSRYGKYVSDSDTDIAFHVVGGVDNVSAFQ